MHFHKYSIKIDQSILKTNNYYWIGFNLVDERQLTRCRRFNTCSLRGAVGALVFSLRLCSHVTFEDLRMFTMELATCPERSMQWLQRFVEPPSWWRKHVVWAINPVTSNHCCHKIRNWFQIHCKVQCTSLEHVFNEYFFQLEQSRLLVKNNFCTWS